MPKRLLFIFILGFSSGLPFALLSSTLQAWYAEAGVSLLATGLLSLIGLPYTYRVIFAPLLDRYTCFFPARRQSWILVMQLALCTGFNALTFFSPHTSPQIVAVLAFFLAFLSALQDTAIDAHRIEYLRIAEHPWGATMAVLGYRLALIIGGGVALIIASYKGWIFTYRIISLLMLPGMIATLFSKEPAPIRADKLNFTNTFVVPIKELFTRLDWLPLLGLVFFFKLGEVFTTTTSGIVMPFLLRGLEFPLDIVGYVNKIIGIVALVFGGLASGILLWRCSLFNSLMICGLLQAATNSMFILLAMTGKNLTIFILAVVCDNFAAGMGSTVLVVLFMRLVNKAFTATQFAVLISVSNLPRVLSGLFLTLLGPGFNWVNLYELSFILSFIFIPFLIRIKTQLTMPANRLVGDTQEAQRTYDTKHTITSIQTSPFSWEKKK